MAVREPGASSIREAVGQCYAAFCGAADHEYHVKSFALRLTAEIPEARVQVVLLDRFSEGLYFIDEGEGANQRFWRVTVDDEDFLLPRPANRERFDFLKGFDTHGTGSARPRPLALQKCLPALLARTDDQWVMKEPGKLTFSGFTSNNSQSPYTATTANLNKAFPAGSGKTVEPIAVALKANTAVPTSLPSDPLPGKAGEEIDSQRVSMPANPYQQMIAGKLRAWLEVRPEPAFPIGIAGRPGKPVGACGLSSPYQKSIEEKLRAWLRAKESIEPLTGTVLAAPAKEPK